MALIKNQVIYDRYFWRNKLMRSITINLFVYILTSIKQKGPTAINRKPLIYMTNSGRNEQTRTADPLDVDSPIQSQPTDFINLLINPTSPSTTVF